uniref:RING-type domain-containing protein n=1 Tax=Heterosigma akashiwo TaxID=2829 RepID=A0A7S3XPD3_HETAK
MAGLPPMRAAMTTPGPLYPGGQRAEQVLGGDAAAAAALARCRASAEADLFREWDALLQRFHFKMVVFQAAQAASCRARYQSGKRAHQSSSEEEEKAPRTTSSEETYFDTLTDNTVEKETPNIMNSQQTTASGLSKNQNVIKLPVSSNEDLCKSCQVCFDECVGIELEPCGHQMCRSCAIKMHSFKKEQGQHSVCPWDRTTVKSFKDLATRKEFEFPSDCFAGPSPGKKEKKLEGQGQEGGEEDSGITTSGQGGGKTESSSGLIKYTSLI